MGIETALGVGKVLAPSLIGGLLGGKGSSQSGTQTQTQQQTLDPRMQEILYGKDGQGGLLSQIMQQSQAPQSEGLKQFGTGLDELLGQTGVSDTNSIRNAALGLLGGNQAAPTMTAAEMTPASVSMQALRNLPQNISQMTPAQMEAARINAPEQNTLGLSKGYNDLIYGEAGNNPYLTGAIQKGLNQAQNTYGNLVEDQTSAVQDALASIRGGAISSGQYGGSRQGLAESRAIADMSKNLSRAGSQIGQNAQDAAVAAQSGAYDADRNRMLSALGNLSGQQYGVASQDTAAENAARGMNANFQQQANQFNTNWLNQAGLGQTDAMRQALFKNADYQQQASGQNAGFKQQANQQTGNWDLQNRAQNMQGISTGAGLLGNTLGNTFQGAQAQDMYGLNKLGMANSMIAPYTTAGSTNTSSTPLYQNKGANFLGGALMGNQIGGALGGLFGRSNTSNPTSFLNAFGSGY